MPGPAPDGTPAGVTSGDGAIDHDPLTGDQPLVDKHPVALPVADFDLSPRGLAILVYDPYVVALWALQQSTLRNENTVGAYRTPQLNTDKLPRPQIAFGVGKIFESSDLLVQVSGRDPITILSIAVLLTIV